MTQETKVQYAACILAIAYGIEAKRPDLIEKGRDRIKELNKKHKLEQL